MITVGTPSVIVGQTCEACGQCCGGTCIKYKACRQACYPCCTDSVLWDGNLDLPALYPVAVNTTTGKIAAFDPNVPEVSQAVGVTMHPVFTDANGRMTNYRPMMVVIPNCGEFTGVIWTSGEFLVSEIAGGNDNIISALLTQPAFAKPLPNGYLRIL